MDLDIINQLNNLSLIDIVDVKQQIKDKFDLKLKNKKFDETMKQHCGSEGCWVESHFKEGADNNTHADFHGIELKKDSSKITFGDWSADEYIFNPKDRLKQVNGDITIDRQTFMKLFGHENITKKRYSWSGSTSPSKCNQYTNSGQTLLCDDKNNIYAIYRYQNDKRRYADIPENIKSKEYIILAYWSIDSLETKISKKFNNHGTAIFQKNKNKEYVSIRFCKPIDVNLFIAEFKKQNIIFDSGMFEGNSRNYSQFRASKSFWEVITDEIY